MKKMLAGLLFFFVCGIPQNILSQGQEFNVENEIYIKFLPLMSGSMHREQE